MRTRTLLVTVAAMVALTAPPAGARVPEKTPRRALEAKVGHTLGRSPAKQAEQGIVVSRGGRVLLSVNADEPLVPASLLKLATTATAIDRFGPDHRFTTRVVAPVAPKAGAVTSLIVVGGGDPTLATEQYRQERFIGKPKPDDPNPVPVFVSRSPTIEDLARAIAARGITRVAGDIVVDGTLFDSVRVQPGWLPDYIGNDPETGFLDGLDLNEGFSDPQGHGLYQTPSRAAGLALRGALIAQGVTVVGSVREGIAPRGAPAIASVASPPLSEIVAYTNRWSINNSAEFLLKDLGAAFGGAGTSEAGIRVVRTTLTRLGIPLEGFAQFDGSGLSVLDRMTPSTIAALLQHFLNEKGPKGEALRASLPVAGQPGTLYKRMRRSAAAGNLRGKTGTIHGVRAMAGWVTPRDDVPIVYVLLFNRVARPSLLTNPIDLLGIALALYQ